MNAIEKRMFIAGIASIFSVIGMVITPNFIFSGDAIRYAGFVQAQILGWIVTGGFASVALVLSAPALWLGTRRQIVFATVLFLIAALVLVVTYTEAH